MFLGGNGPAAPAFLFDGGVAGAALRELEHDGAGLGPPVDWPPALRSAVALCLHAAVPIAVFWGPRFRFIFGDAWLPLLGGRTAGAMARPAEEVLPDLWPVIGADMQRAMDGAGVRAEEVAMPLAGPGGLPSPDAWWTYSFSPVMDSSGRRLGVLAHVADVTDGVLDRRRQEAILTLADRFASLHDVDAIVSLGCEVVGRTLNAGRVVRALIDERAGTATLGGAWSGDPALPPVDGVMPLDRFWAEWTAGPAALGPLHVDDTGADPATAPQAAAFARRGVAAFLSVPVLEEDRIQVVTLAESAVPRPWRASDLAFLRDVVSRGRSAALRARMESALRESDTRNRHSVEMSRLYSWTADAAGNVNHVDERLAARTGCTGLGASWMEAVHPDDRATSDAAWQDALASGERYDVEYRVSVRGDDTRGPAYRWMRSRANPQRDASGRIAMWYGSTEDVDDARRASASLASSEARLRAITDSIDQMVWSTLPDGLHDYYNRTWYEYTGVPFGSTDGEGWSGVFHPDDRARAWDTWTRSLRTGEHYHIEYRLRHRSGEYRWVLGRAHPMRDGAGRIERWYGTCTDIQEIVEAREVLARSREQLESRVAETAADRERMWRLSTELMALLRSDGVITAVNPAWQRVLGWHPSDLLGRTLERLIHPDDRLATVKAMRRLRRGQPVPPAENRVLGRDGAWRVLSWTAVPEGGHIHAIGRDNTAERHAAHQLLAAQDSLRQAQKMEAVGQLTGGIAHDFNNMLAVVIGSLDLLARRMNPDDARARRYVDNAMEGAHRAAALTRGLLAFSRQQALSPVVLDLDELLDGMTGWLRSSLGAPVRLELAHGAGLWPVLLDRNGLENAVLNLAVNARDAMPQGGTLRVATDNVTVAFGETVVAAGGPLAPGAYVRLRVTDTGTGIPPGVISRVFDPFFTTKEVGKGTGLGLSQVYGFVAQSGGYVGIQSSEGAGTMVSIHLPRHEGMTPELDRAVAPAGSTDADQSFRGTVLVVEDEPAVRRYTAEAVAELGFRVLEADGAATAWPILDGDDSIRLLLTDIVMPDTDGRTLAGRALERRPGLKVLFASGFARDDDRHPATNPNGTEVVLAKPFTLEELATAVRRVMG